MIPTPSIKLEHVQARPPLLTAKVCEQMQATKKRSLSSMMGSLDLDRTETAIELFDAHWKAEGLSFPYLQKCKERTIYYWNGKDFEPVARFSGSLIKLVPTEWGAPTFEIDGIKMLPTAKISPYDDARQKVALIEPRGKILLDTCGGLGYFAAWCIAGGAARIFSFEKSPDVVWLRSLNPWSPRAADPLTLQQGDITQELPKFADSSVDGILHDPPRFGIAGELYSQNFYDQLARVIKRNGKLFHYTGTPNKLTSGRDVPKEVAARLQRAGFATEIRGDGVLAIKRAR